MTYTVADSPSRTPIVPVAPTVMLQRLANPNLPSSTTLGAGYNPYVTVDYVNLDPLKSAATGINPAINDARTYDVNGAINAPPTSPIRPLLRGAATSLTRPSASLKPRLSGGSSSAPR